MESSHDIVKSLHWLAKNTY